jgi:hypothetical protein
MDRAGRNFLIEVRLAVVPKILLSCFIRNVLISEEKRLIDQPDCNFPKVSRWKLFILSEPTKLFAIFAI